MTDATASLNLSSALPLIKAEDLSDDYRHVKARLKKDGSAVVHYACIEVDPVLIVLVSDRALYLYDVEGKFVRCLEVADVVEIVRHGEVLGFKVPTQYDLRLHLPSGEASKLLHVFGVVYKSLTGRGFADKLRTNLPSLDALARNLWLTPPANWRPRPELPFSTDGSGRGLPTPEDALREKQREVDRLRALLEGGEAGGGGGGAGERDSATAQKLEGLEKQLAAVIDRLPAPGTARSADEGSGGGGGDGAKGDVFGFPAQSPHTPRSPYGYSPMGGGGGGGGGGGLGTAFAASPLSPSAALYGLGGGGGGADGGALRYLAANLTRQVAAATQELSQLKAGAQKQQQAAAASPAPAAPQETPETKARREALERIAALEKQLAGRDKKGGGKKGGGGGGGDDGSDIMGRLMKLEGYLEGRADGAGGHGGSEVSAAEAAELPQSLRPGGGGGNRKKSTDVTIALFDGGGGGGGGEGADAPPKAAEAAAPQPPLPLPLSPSPGALAAAASKKPRLPFWGGGGGGGGGGNPSASRSRDMGWNASTKMTGSPEAAAAAAAASRLFGSSHPAGLEGGGGLASLLASSQQQQQRRGRRHRGGDPVVDDDVGFGAAEPPPRWFRCTTVGAHHAVRAQPSTAAERVGQVQRGDEVAVCGEHTDEQGQRWVRLQSGGWCLGGYDDGDGEEDCFMEEVPAGSLSPRHMGAEQMRYVESLAKAVEELETRIGARKVEMRSARDDGGSTLCDGDFGYEVQSTAASADAAGGGGGGGGDPEVRRLEHKVQQLQDTLTHTAHAVGAELGRQREMLSAELRVLRSPHNAVQLMPAGGGGGCGGGGADADASAEVPVEMRDVSPPRRTQHLTPALDDALVLAQRQQQQQQQQHPPPALAAPSPVRPLQTRHHSPEAPHRHPAALSQQRSLSPENPEHVQAAADRRLFVGGGGGGGGGLPEDIPSPSAFLPTPTPYGAPRGPLPPAPSQQQLLQQPPQPQQHTLQPQQQQLQLQVPPAPHVRPPSHSHSPPSQQMLAPAAAAPYASPPPQQQLSHSPLCADGRGLWRIVAEASTVRRGAEMASKRVALLPQAEVVRVEEVRGNRALITSPVSGWVSLVDEEGVQLMVPSNAASSTPTRRSYAVDGGATHARRQSRAKPRAASGAASPRAAAADGAVRGGGGSRRAPPPDAAPQALLPPPPDPLRLSMSLYPASATPSAQALEHLPAQSQQQRSRSQKRRGGGGGGSRTSAETSNAAALEFTARSREEYPGAAGRRRSSRGESLVRGAARASSLAKHRSRSSSKSGRRAFR